MTSHNGGSTSLTPGSSYLRLVQRFLPCFWWPPEAFVWIKLLCHYRKSPVDNGWYKLLFFRLEGRVALPLFTSRRSRTQRPQRMPCATQKSTVEGFASIFQLQNALIRRHQASTWANPPSKLLKPLFKSFYLKWWDKMTSLKRAEVQAVVLIVRISKKSCRLWRHLTENIGLNLKISFCLSWLLTFFVFLQPIRRRRWWWWWRWLPRRRRWWLPRRSVQRRPPSRRWWRRRLRSPVSISLLQRWRRWRPQARLQIQIEVLFST